tara:strand:- start:759 stop:977 length:219 start_codon:yes stop_codon:yes gene_type:complete
MRNSVTTENLLDLAAFIQKAAEKGHMENEAILIHAQHDIEGFLTPDSDPSKQCWLPRTTGWRNYDLKLLGQR